jgi:RimJ/RimL family protein N-acetyltransferase
LQKTPDQISIRDFAPLDLPGFMDYWYRSAPGYLESLGIDPRTVLAESVLLANWLALCSSGEPMPALTILVKGKAAGIYLLSEVVAGESAVFHAHVWESSLRHKGIATESAPKAFKVFFERFRLKRLVFKVPAQNGAALRVLGKLGIRSTGEGAMEAGLYRKGLPSKLFELTAVELAK